MIGLLAEEVVGRAWLIPVFILGLAALAATMLQGPPPSMWGD